MLHVNLHAAFNSVVNLTTTLSHRGRRFSESLWTHCRISRWTLSQTVKSQHLLIAGGSHATRLARFAQAAGQMCANVTRSGWPAGNAAVESVSSNLAVLGDEITASHVADLQLIGNVAYVVMTSEDTIIQFRRDNKGNYHMQGDIMLAPQERLNPYLKNYLPIFSVLEENLKLILVPHHAI